MIDMTPFVDCARKLGLDPAAALGPIAATGADWFREAFEEFVARSDLTLAAFGWSIVDTSNGREYRFAWPTSQSATSNINDSVASNPATPGSASAR
jgi:hypothetical protein